MRDFCEQVVLVACLVVIAAAFVTIGGIVGMGLLRAFGLWG
jgi:hypothetical protein